jgi:general secretion pathway protein G
MLNIMKKKNSKGFTLIELMMIVAILGMMSSLIVASINDARKKGRDAKRISDMGQIQKALEIYLDKTGDYPGVIPVDDGGGWDIGCGAGDVFIDELKRVEGTDTGSFSQVPTDQMSCDHSGTGGYWYGYHRYNAGDNGCPADRGSYYVLGFFSAEATGRQVTGNPHPESPGFSCSGQDWQLGFDWVAGGFEK